MPSPSPTLLEQLEAAGCKVDVDSFDPAVAQSIPFTPHDATSNQALIGLQVFDPTQHEVVESTVREMPDASPHEVLTVLHAKFAKLQIPNISGRVLAQTSPSYPNDKEKIIEHARAYAKACNAEGITNERFCIKIPTTSAGVQAAVQLKQEGIASLGTVLFSLPQAIAASQAGMHAISPYFNPVIAHSDASYWSDVEDPVTQHPMASRMVHIRQMYDRLAKETGRPQPQIKGAGYVTGREVMAAYELGCDHVTVLPASIKDLLSHTQMPSYRTGERDNRISDLDKPNLAYSDWIIPEPTASARRLAQLAKVDPLGPKMQADLKFASTHIDYLADGVLDEIIAQDEVTRFRLDDAVAAFKAAEEKLFAHIANVRTSLV